MRFVINTQSFMLGFYILIWYLHIHLLNMQTLLGFVNLRLYHSIKLKYPPILDPRLKALAAGMNLNLL